MVAGRLWDSANERAPLEGVSRTSGADLSPCGRYRYSLWRTWDESLPPDLWVMLNPSTADASADDPTIRKCVKFSRRWGAGGIVVCNLYPWRATDPKALPRGPEVLGAHEHNARAIRDARRTAGRIIVAWGADPGPSPGQPRRVTALLVNGGQRHVFCLALTKDGQPRHPLYLRDDTPLQPYPEPTGAA